MGGHRREGRSCTIEQARRALMAIKRRNFEVDPNNTEHVEKYREMRLKFARISPAEFITFLETGRSTVSAGSQSSRVYWAVPKANFPKGLPKKIKATEVAEGDEGAPMDVDRKNFFVIDQVVSRQQTP